MLEIITNPELLRQPCFPVKGDERQLYKPIITEMKRFVLDNNGLGLAAPQVGIAKLFFVLLVSPGHVIPIFNPWYTRLTEETIEFRESCFSCPGVEKLTNRPRSIKLFYNDALWNNKRKVFNDTLAIVIQHEIDHLKGKLISDL
jgi:peptide deformylase